MSGPKPYKTKFLCFNLLNLDSNSCKEFFTFGPNDLAQSMGLPGEPNHNEVKIAIEEAIKKIHDNGKKIVDDDQILANVQGLILDSARSFVSKNSD